MIKKIPRLFLLAVKFKSHTCPITLLVLKSGELIANLNRFENFAMVMTISIIIILFNIFYLLESFPNLTFHTGSIAVDFVSG